MRFLTIDDFDFKGKTVFLRVDMNCPIDPETLEISGTKRIEEIVETVNSLNNAKIVIASHQGRVGNKDYTGMEKHAKVLEELLGRKVVYVSDVMGSSAQSEIKKLNDGEILLLDNLRLCAEENYEFSGSNAAKTIMVRHILEQMCYASGSKLLWLEMDTKLRDQTVYDTNHLHRARDLTHCDDYHQNIFAEKFIQILGNDGGY